jgi:hypothetical protein
MVETAYCVASIENRGVVFIAAPVPNIIIKTYIYFGLFNNTASSAETSLYSLYFFPHWLYSLLGP